MLAPSRASPKANARPMPLPAPVITIPFPATRPGITVPSSKSDRAERPRMPANVNLYLTTCPAPGIFGAAPHRRVFTRTPTRRASRSPHGPHRSRRRRHRHRRLQHRASPAGGRLASGRPVPSAALRDPRRRARLRGRPRPSVGGSAPSAGKAITHLFFTTWSRQDTEADNCRVNGAMLANTLDALRRTAELRARGARDRSEALPRSVRGVRRRHRPTHPFRESQDRLPFQNFYYDQEDILFAAAAERGFSWSVHRPHTMIGYALGNVMNMGVTLAVYGTICRVTGEPFVFPGSPQQYGGVTDITDARLLGRHAVWSATEPAARNQAFNTVNGDVFRWRQMWKRVADGLGVEAAEYPGEPNPLDGRMGHADDVWAGLVERARPRSRTRRPNSRRGGTPTPTWAGRSRRSPTCPRVVPWASWTSRTRRGRSWICSTLSARRRSSRR